MSPTASTLPCLEAKVRAYRGAEGGSLLGFAELTVGKSFVIKEIRIVQGKRESPFVSFPSKPGRGPEGKYYDIVHPITVEAHRRATELILEAYRKASASPR